MAAAATRITKLPEVLRSPTSLQYVEYMRHFPSKSRTSPHFKPRFTFKEEDRKHTVETPIVREVDPLMPPYPYGANTTFKEANFGLYGGATVTTGSKISKGRNKGKTPRHWFPNVRVETVTSEALGRELKIPITARVMRTIRKCGGIDQYVTGDKPARIKELGLLGWKLRWLVMTSDTWRQKTLAELERRNLPVHWSLLGTFEDAWNDEKTRTKMIEQQESAWKDLREAAARFEKHVQNEWIEMGERQTYEIPKLETLQRTTPSALGLPESLEPSSPRRVEMAAVSHESGADHVGTSVEEQQEQQQQQSVDAELQELADTAPTVDDAQGLDQSPERVEEPSTTAR